MDELKAQGIFSLLRLRWEVWIEERAADHIARRENSRQIILAAEQKSVEQAISIARAVEEMNEDKTILGYDTVSARCGTRPFEHCCCCRSS